MGVDDVWFQLYQQITHSIHRAKSQTRLLVGT